MTNDKGSFWDKLRYKYRLSIMNEDTFTETWHTRLSRMGVFLILVFFFVLVLALYSVLIIYTPIRNILPGYSESIRQQLISESVRVDSLANTLSLQTRYISVVRDVMAGEAQTDSIQSLDSMQIIMREELLEAKSQATADFMAQYEERERDNLQLFDIQQTAPTLTFFRPAHGVIVNTFQPQQQHYGVDIQLPEKENITAILDGTIVYVQYEIDNTYTMLIQHNQYLALYSHIGRVLKSIGNRVKIGESVGLASEQPLHFELWTNGEAINPEEVIAF